MYMNSPSFELFVGMSPVEIKCRSFVFKDTHLFDIVQLMVVSFEIYF